MSGIKKLNIRTRGSHVNLTGTATNSRLVTLNKWEVPRSDDDSPTEYFFVQHRSGVIAERDDHSYENPAYMGHMSKIDAKKRFDSRVEGDGEISPKNDQYSSIVKYAVKAPHKVTSLLDKAAAFPLFRLKSTVFTEAMTHKIADAEREADINNRI